MYWNKKDSECNPYELRRLQNENDQYRDREERRWREEEKRREEPAKEIREEIESRYRSARTWREALEKQVFLYRREANQYPLIDEATGLDDFAVSAEACTRACQIWDELAGIKQAEIEALEAKLEALRDSIRIEVAQRLRAETSGQLGSGSIESFVIKSLLEGGDPEDWLNW